MRPFAGFAIVLLIISSHAQSRPLVTDFASLRPALKEGKEVRAVIHYGRCRLVTDGKESKSPDAIGGMSFETFEYFAAGSIGNPKAYVTTSETMLISHPSKGYVYNYVKLKVYEDSAVDVVARYLNPSTFEVVMDEIFFAKISTTTENRDAYFFVHHTEEEEKQ